jgi:hypothetical protein
LGSQRRRRTVERRDHSYPTLNQISGHCRQSIILALRPTIFDREVPPLYVASFGQTFVKRRD